MGKITSLPATVQFAPVRTPSGKLAYEAFCAVLKKNGSDVALCAPTLALLKMWWREASGDHPFDERGAQKVWIVKREDGPGL